MGGDATDLYVRLSRQLAGNLKLGLDIERSVRLRGQAIPETMHAFGADLAWRASHQTELQLGYAVQRVQNPLQLTSVSPVLRESAAPGTTAINRLLWAGLTMQF
jgi:hypothetical protein